MRDLLLERAAVVVGQFLERRDDNLRRELDEVQPEQVLLAPELVRLVGVDRAAVDAYLVRVRVGIRVGVEVRVRVRVRVNIRNGATSRRTGRGWLGLGLGLGLGVGLG